MNYWTGTDAKGRDVENQRSEREPSERFSRLWIMRLDVEVGS